MWPALEKSRPHTIDQDWGASLNGGLQTIGGDQFFHGMLQYQVKTIAVVIREKDTLAGIAAENDVINGPWIMDAWFACHALTVAVNSSKLSLTPKNFPAGCNSSFAFLFRLSLGKDILSVYVCGEGGGIDFILCFGRGWIVPFPGVFVIGSFRLRNETVIYCNLFLRIKLDNAPVRFKQFVFDYYFVFPRFDLKIFQGRGPPLLFAVYINYSRRSDVEFHVGD